MEAIDAIEAFGFGEGFCAGNVIKYVLRHKKKGGVDDLRKAARYLDRLIEQKIELKAKGEAHEST